MAVVSASREVALGVRCGRIPVAGRRASRADALVAVEVRLVARVAREDDALAGLAADASGVRDGRAILAFSGRGAASAGLERLRSVKALVCDAKGRAMKSMSV